MMKLCLKQKNEAMFNDTTTLRYISVVTYTHVKKRLFADVFGGSYSRRGDEHRLHLCQVDVASAVRVLPRVVVPQL